MKLMILFENFEKYYEEKKVNDIIKEFKDYYKQKKVKLDNTFNLLINFREYYNQKKINIKKLLQILEIITIKKIRNVNR